MKNKEHGGYYKVRCEIKWYVKLFITAHCDCHISSYACENLEQTRLRTGSELSSWGVPSERG